MRRKLIVAFLAVAFLAYWLTEREFDETLSVSTITPNIKRIIEPKKLPEPAEAVSNPAPKRAPAEAETIEKWLNREAERIGVVDMDPAQTLIRLKQKAIQLESKELRKLKQLALEKSVTADARFLAVYLLGLVDGNGAVTLLKEVCFARIPAVATDREHSDELLLRAQSLETLVQRLSQREARVLLREVLARTSDPILARQAQYWLSKLS